MCSEKFLKIEHAIFHKGVPYEEGIKLTTIDCGFNLRLGGSSDAFFVYEVHGDLERSLDFSLYVTDGQAAWWSGGWGADT